MALQFYNLKVKDIVNETKEAISITFEIPKELKSIFSYKHGQFLTLRFFIDGKDQRRSYSISSCPVLDEEITITVKCITDGIVSNFIKNNLKVNNILEIMPPVGNFTIDLNSANAKTYFLVGAGSGITPLMSIISTILEIEKNSKVYLIYVNKSEDSIIFYKKLNQIKNKYFENFHIHYLLDQPNEHWDGDKGRLDSQKLQKLIDTYIPNQKLIAEYFLCGPNGLMSECLNALQIFNIQSNKIHKESFVTDSKDKEQVFKTDVPNHKNIDEIKVILYGEEHSLSIEKDETILVAGMRAGIDPPFSCQIGACSTCRAKVISGQVKMEDDDALTESEIQQGYVLTCTSYPISEDVVISYDD